MSKLTIDDIRKACEQRQPIMIGPHVLYETFAEADQPCVNDHRNKKKQVVITIYTWLDKTDAELHEDKLEIENELRNSPFFD